MRKVAKVCSQFNHFLEDTVANMAVQFVFRHDFYRPFEHLGQLIGEGQTLGEQVVTTGKVRQKIDIAVGALFSPGHNTKHPYAACVILVTKALNGITSAVQLVEQHRRSY